MLSQKRILICPLNWGLGHATRCVPIIRLLIGKNATVIIGGEGRALELLKQEFPDLEFVYLKGAGITYPKNGSMAWNMFLSIPKIIHGIYREHRLLKKIIQKKKIDVVISDNRYGLWNKRIKSIFITHQLIIKTPFAEKLLYRINLFFIKKYTECWVPDVDGSNSLSGDLSHKYPLPSHVFFIGPLSRFENKYRPDITSEVYDIMAIISGPEPQRSIFEKIVIEQVQQSKLKALIVCGKTELGFTKQLIGNMEIVSHLKSEAMQEAIIHSKIIISRSGYSTVMDLAVLRKRCIFVPTPGQTEQEYLAERFLQQKNAYYQKQSEFDLQKALKEAVNYKGLGIVENNYALEERVNAFS